MPLRLDERDLTALATCEMHRVWGVQGRVCEWFLCTAVCNAVLEQRVRTLTGVLLTRMP